MSECVEKIEHSCGSHSLQVFLNEDGSYTGFCFSCKTFEIDPYKDRPKDYKPTVIRKSAEQIASEIAEINTYKTVGLPDRKLKKEYLEYFNVKIGVSEQDGESPVSHHYPYTKDGKLTGYKNRIIEGKRMWSSGDLKECDLFGWQQAIASGSKKLFITEGECDAVALFQVLMDSVKGTKYAEMVPAVVSLPTGAGTAGKTAARLKNEILKHFKPEEIVLVFDMDEPGKQAVVDFQKIFPEAKSATLPEKDANECVLKGKNKILRDAVVFKASAPQSTRLVRASDVYMQAKTPPKMGLSYPYPALTKLTRGRRFGETYYFGAGVKMGKSELLNDLVAHDIKEHGLTVMCAKPEESNARTLQGVVGKFVNRIFHDPDIEFDHAAFDRGFQELDNRLVMLNLYQDLSWEVLKSDIRVAVGEGAKSIYIDPITVLSNNFDAAAANAMLQKVAQEFAAMAMQLDFMGHIFCHLKSPENGPSHERGAPVQSNQFAGSRAMMRSCHAMIGMEGNKDPDLPEEDRNIRTLVLLEDRMTGASGKVKLFWDKSTGAFNPL